MDLATRTVIDLMFFRHHLLLCAPVYCSLVFHVALTVKEPMISFSS